MLDYFRRNQDPSSRDPFTRTVLTASTGNPVTMLWNAFVHTAQLLAKNSMIDQAHWVLDFAREQRPDLIGEAATFPFSSRQLDEVLVPDKEKHPIPASPKVDREKEYH
jgi:hypothetical protein